MLSECAGVSDDGIRLRRRAGDDERPGQARRRRWESRRDGHPFDHLRNPRPPRAGDRFWWSICPVAEDFVGAFNVGAVREDGTRDNQYLSPMDVAGVSLLGIKELIKENQDLRETIEELRRQLEDLKHR